MAYCTRKYRSISEVPPEQWDGLVSDGQLYNQHKFIQVVERSNIEQADYWYLLFYEEDELIGHAVLSAFVISLDLFISNEKATHFIKAVRPRFFDVKILFCGLPASLGQLNLAIKGPDNADPVTRMLAEEMERIAASERIRLLCVKEFKGSEFTQCTQLLEDHYFHAQSIPYMWMPVRWSDFQDYLASLRHHYRRAIKLSLKKLGVTSSPVVETSRLSQWSPELLYDMYLGVMSRAETRLETLNLDFFKHLIYAYGQEMNVLAVRHKGEVLSYGIVFTRGDQVNFMLAGHKDTADQVDSYFNLVYGILDHTINTGGQRLNLGQTSYWIKQRIGGIPEEVTIYFKSRRKWVNLILKVLNPLVFPKLALQSVRVFKE